MGEGSETQVAGAETPQAYKEGFATFRGLKFRVDERVLVPRKESELLVEEALKLPSGSHVHEVGTGSGAIAIALAKERPDICVTASDIDHDATEVASINALELGAPVTPFECFGLPPGFVGSEPMRLDLLLANLPYLTPESIELRDPSVKAEPQIATIGIKKDGIGNIERLILECPSGLMVALEHDTHMGEAVRDMLKDAETRIDQNDQERMTIGMVP